MDRARTTKYDFWKRAVCCVAAKPPYNATLPFPEKMMPPYGCVGRISRASGNPPIERHRRLRFEEKTPNEATREAIE